MAVRYHSAMAVHSLAADVVDSLGRRIVNGHLQPGDVLRLDHIGTEFKVVKPIVGDRGTVTLSATKTDGLIEVAGRGSPTVQR